MSENPKVRDLVGMSDNRFDMDDIRSGEPQSSRGAGVLPSVEQTFAQRTVAGAFPEVGAAATAIQSTVNQFNDLAPAIQRIVAQVETSSSAFVDMTSQVCEIIDGVKKALLGQEILQNYVTQIVDAVVILVDLFILVVKKNFENLPTLVIRLLNVFRIPGHLANFFVCKFRTAANVSSLELQQGSRSYGAGQSFHTSPMVDAVSALVGAGILGTMPSKEQLHRTNERLKLINSVRSATGNASDMLFSVLSLLPACVQNWLHYVLPERWWISCFEPGSKYCQWLDEVEALKGYAVQNDLFFDSYLQNRITNVYKTGVELLRESAIVGTKPGTFRILELAFKTIDELYKNVDLAGYRTSSRPVPFSLYLYGGPGIGKSHLCTVIPPILFGVPSNTENLIYSRNQAVAHWDGYTGQSLVQYDDFGASRNPAISPGEAAEIMSIVSNVMYALPMAAISDKGGFFRSQAVMITSNSGYPRFNHIPNAEALWRRRNLLYHVELRDPSMMDPKTSRVDSARIDPVTNAHLIFKRMHPTKENEIIRSGMSYFEFMAEVQAEFKRHKKEQLLAVSNREIMLQEMDRQLREIRQETGIDMRNYGVGQVGGEPDEFDYSRLAPGARRASHPSLLEQSRNLGAPREESWSRQLHAEMCTKANQTKPASNWIRALELACLIFGGIGMTYGIYQHFTKKKLKKQIAEKDIYIQAQAYYISVLLEGGAPLNKIIGDLKAKYNAADEKSRHDTLLALREFGRANPGVMDHLVDLVFKDDNEAKNFLIGEGVYTGITGKTHGIIAKPAVVRGFQAQGLDLNANDLATNVLPSNLVQIEVGSNAMNGIFIRDRICIFPAHIFIDRSNAPNLYPDGTSMCIRTKDAVFQDVFDHRRAFPLADDLVAYRVSYNSRSWKDITHLFWKDSDLQHRQKIGGTCVFYSTDGILTHISTTFKRNVYHATYDCSGRKMEVQRHFSWEYDPLAPGACGAMLIVNDNRCARKLCGLHIAGDSNYGLGLIVTQEMLANIPFPRTCVRGEIPPLPHLENVAEGRMIPFGNFTQVGALKTAIYQADKTKIRRSLLYGRIAIPTKAPSVLSRKDPRMDENFSPLKKGIEKYGNRAPVIPVDLKVAAFNHIFNHFATVQYYPKRVLTIDEAINGISEVAFIDPLIMDTSAGFPYNQRPHKMDKLTGKRGLFGGDHGGFFIEDKELLDNYSNRLEMAKDGLRVPSGWIDQLKDELRTLEQVRLGKTRVFTIPPLDFTLVFRQYVLAFNAFVMENCMRWFSAVGIDTHSQQWTNMVTQLLSVSSTGFAGDYSGWDGNLSPELIIELGHRINRWYDDGVENARVRNVLFDEIAHTMQIALNSVYITHIGNPSGNPMTTILNTILNAVYLRMAWMVLAPSSEKSLIIFDQKVRDFIYGDDNILAVTEDAQDFFNPEGIGKVLNQWNLKYTSAAKDGEAQIEPVMKLTFLKCGIRREGVEFFPLLDWKTVENMPMWYRENDTETVEKLVLDNCNESLRAAWFYGVEKFNWWRSVILKNLPDSWKMRLNDYSFYHNQRYKIAGPSTCKQLVQRLDVKSIFDVRDYGLGQSSTPDNSKGVISIDQRIKNETSTAFGRGVSNFQLGRAANNEGEWSLADMTNRRVLENVYTWTVMNSRGTVLVRKNCPQEFLTNYLQTAAFERYSMWSGTMRVTIRVNGTRFYAGRLQAYFVPNANVLATQNWHERSFQASQSVAHGFLDATMNNELQLDIPFYNIRSFLPLHSDGSDDSMFTGVFVVQVLSPLTAVSSSPQSINFNVWVEFLQDQRFQIPYIVGLTDHHYFNKKHEKMVKSYGQGQGNTLTTNYNVDNYGEIDGMTTPINMTGDSIGNGNSATIPMDKPARTANSLSVYRTAFQNFSQTTGSETLNRLDLHPANLSLSIDEHFGTDTDEMDLTQLWKKPTLMTYFNWNAADGPGTVLGSWFAGPMMSRFDSGSPTSRLIDPNALIRDFTLWEYNCLPFSQWRGSIEIRLDFVATQMHTGRVFLGMHYMTQPANNITIDQAVSQYGVEIDLNNEQHSFVFNIPYKALTPWLKIYNGLGIDYNISQRDQSTQVDSYHWDFFLGSFSVSVVNALVAPDSAPPNIEVLLSVCGGPDFECYYPGANGSTFAPLAVTNEPFTGRLNKTYGKGQSAEKTADDEAEVPTMLETAETKGVEIAPPGDKQPDGKNLHFGRFAPVRHIGDVIKRYTACNQQLGQKVIPFKGYTFGSNVVDGEALDDSFGFTLIRQGNENKNSVYLIYVYEQVMPLKISNDVAIQEGCLAYQNAKSPLTHFGAQFKMHRGSMRYKALFGRTSINGGDEVDIQKYGAVYIPEPTYTSTSLHQPGLSSFRVGLNMLAPYFAGMTDGGGGNSDTVLTEVPLPQVYPLGGALAHGSARYLDVEIPFVTQFNSLWNPTALSALNVGAHHLMTGLVMFYAYFATTGDPAFNTSLQTNGLTMDWTILKAAGDEFRFGVLLGPPPMRCHATYKAITLWGDYIPAWPDRWKFISPTDDQERDDYDVVPKQNIRKKYGQAQMAEVRISPIPRQPEAYQVIMRKHYDEMNMGQFKYIDIESVGAKVLSSIVSWLDEAIDTHSIPTLMRLLTQKWPFHLIIRINTDPTFGGRVVVHCAWDMRSADYAGFDRMHGEITNINLRMERDVMSEVYFHLINNIMAVIRSEFKEVELAYKANVQHLAGFQDRYKLASQRKTTWQNVKLVPIDGAPLAREATKDYGQGQMGDARLPCTKGSYATVEPPLWKKYMKEEWFTARSAFNELSQKISDCSTKYSVVQEGEDHTPAFYCIAAHSTLATDYQLTGSGRSLTKKDAEEAAAIDLFSKLHIKIHTAEASEVPSSPPTFKLSEEQALDLIRIMDKNRKFLGQGTWSKKMQEWFMHHNFDMTLSYDYSYANVSVGVTFEIWKVNLPDQRFVWMTFIPMGRELIDISRNETEFQFFMHVLYACYAEFDQEKVGTTCVAGVITGPRKAT